MDTEPRARLESAAAHMLELEHELERSGKSKFSMARFVYGSDEAKPTEVLGAVGPRHVLPDTSRSSIHSSRERG